MQPKRIKIQFLKSQRNPSLCKETIVVVVVMVAHNSEPLRVQIESFDEISMMSLTFVLLLIDRATEKRIAFAIIYVFFRLEGGVRA